MDALQELGIGLILILQQFSPALDGAMKSFTFLGRLEFYLIIIPFIYWAVDKRLGVRLLLILITSDIIGSNLKLLFHQPRPYWLGRVMMLAKETSYGIPSTHASGSFAVWGYLAYRLNKKWLWTLVGLFIFFIGISRLYLGVHFPHDVLFGWLVGLAVLWAFVRYENQMAAWMNGQRIQTQIGAGFVLSLAVILFGQLVQAWLAGISDPPEWSTFAAQARNPAYVFTDAGSLFGVIAGYTLMKRYARFKNAGSWLQQLGRYVLGMVILLVSYYGLDVLFGMISPDTTLMGYTLRYLRYSTVTFLVAFVVPWIFIKIRLADREEEPGEKVVKAAPSGQKI